ncbi:MAG: radical SAM protein [Candidatus Omnitrophica bacterium]|nr:radical SAM protein [Candidatus Omnitrophota bacterium]
MKYKHALFINPYIERSNTSAMMLFPPTGLEYVAASAKDCVEELTLFDLRYEVDYANPEKLYQFIEENIDIIGVSIGWDRQIKEICELLNNIPKNKLLVVGGYTATEKVEELFLNCPRIDIIVRGEGEETIKDILKGEPVEEISGLSYRSNGKIIHNAHRPLIPVDNFPYPDRSLRRNEYRLTFQGIKAGDLSFDTVLSSRGCPYKCKFCTFTLNPLGQKREYSARSVESVVEEIEKIPAKIILFSDENFSFDAKRAEKLCDLLIERKIKKRYIAQCRIELAQYPRLLEKMVACGFKTLLLGIESPHDKTLALLNKGFNQETIRKYFKTFVRYPLYYHGYFIYGNINETEEEMLYIAMFAREIGVDSITYLKLRIEKFSSLREVVEKTPGYHIASNGVVYSDKYSFGDLKKIGRKIKFTFYTPARFMHMFNKCFIRIKFFTLGEILSLFAILPRVLASLIAKDIKKGRFIDSLRRTFIRNT